jgi:hypothetical protein
MYRAIGNLIILSLILLAIFVPLGVWKLVDIGIWVWKHVHT